MKRVAIWLATVALLGAGLVAVNPAPASADSGWRCRDIGNGELCFRTFKLDYNSIRGADISYRKWGGSCVSISFGHMTVPDHGDYLYPGGIWGDDGSFTICAGQTRTYAWTHAGGGAYVWPAGPVVGFISTAGSGGTQRIYSPPIYRSEI
jgi:hypothetical protein